MFKASLVLASISTISLLSTVPAFAQADWGGAHDSRQTWQQANPGGGGRQMDAGLGQTYWTGTQGADSQGGPMLPGDSPRGGGQNSGAANSAPRKGTKEAPTNINLMYQTRFGNQLPPTRLDGFIRANMDDHKYGDEGANGPPPYNDFTYLDTGKTFDADMTTDHKGQLPSAWGHPQ